MAATNGAKTAVLGLLISLQGCAVQVSEDTPGAAGACDPTVAQLSDFNPPLTAILQNGGSLPGGKVACGSCHLTNSGNPASARFGILPGNDPAAQTANFCSVFPKADQFRKGYLKVSHLGGAYDDSDVQALIDWANAL